MSVHCDCGRFARYDAYYARWWCDRCDRAVTPSTEGDDSRPAASHEMSVGSSRLGGRDDPLMPR